MTRNLFFRYLRFIKPTLCSVNEKYLLFTNSLYILYDFRKFIGSRNSDILLTNSINWKRLPFFWVMSGFLRVSFCCLDFQKRENMGVPRGRIEGIKKHLNFTSFSLSVIRCVSNLRCNSLTFSRANVGI